jgi:hypothetical protein
MKNNFLLVTTYDEARGQVRMHAYELVRDLDTTHNAIDAKHPAVRPFASYGFNQDEVDDLFVSGGVEHTLMAYDFEDYFEGSHISERIEEFLGSLEVYAEQEKLFKIS